MPDKTDRELIREYVAACYSSAMYRAAACHEALDRTGANRLNHDRRLVQQNLAKADGTIYILADILQEIATLDMRR